MVVLAHEQTFARPCERIGIASGSDQHLDDLQIVGSVAEIPLGEGDTGIDVAASDGTVVGEAVGSRRSDRRGSSAYFVPRFIGGSRSRPLSQPLDLGEAGVAEVSRRKPRRSRSLEHLVFQHHLDQSRGEVLRIGSDPYGGLDVDFAATIDQPSDFATGIVDHVHCRPEIFDRLTSVSVIAIAARPSSTRSAIASRTSSTFEAQPEAA